MLARAIAALRDPDGTGRTQVFHGFGGKLRPVPCLKNGCPLDTGHDGPCKATGEP
jgi:hypothetical protein